MMKSTSHIISLLWAIFFISCNAQEKVIESISCNDKIIVQYENTSKLTKKESLEADKNLESFVIYFLNDFDDNIKGFINNQLLFDEKIKTDEVTSDTGKKFGYNYSKDSETTILKVSVEEKNRCFDIQLDKKYKLVYVFLNQEDKWVVRFSNTYYAEH